MSFSKNSFLSKFLILELKAEWFFDCSCERCSDPTELGSYTSSVCCPGCPKKGYLLPCIGTVSDKNKSEAEVKLASKVSEIKLEEEKPSFDDDDDDLDDLLDDLDVNPVLFKKPEDPRLQEITDSKDEDTNDESMEGIMWTCVDCKMNLTGHKVTELLEKTSASMPGVTCNEIAKHEAFLSATATLLHPNNYQVLIVTMLQLTMLLTMLTLRSL